jgi:uncharacterized membrane protein YqaE (UPF0057 family)
VQLIGLFTSSFCSVTNFSLSWLTFTILVLPSFSNTIRQKLSSDPFTGYSLLMQIVLFFLLPFADVLILQGQSSTDAVLFISLTDLRLVEETQDQFFILEYHICGNGS